MWAGFGGYFGARMNSITLPWPPSTNRLWRQWRGRTLLSAEGRAYRAAVARVCLESRCVRLGDAELTLVIDAWMPDRRRRDLDNLLKAAQDSMAHAGIFADDSQIVDLRIRRAGVDKVNPRLECHLQAA